ncbi:hypothetical protein AXF42_Ash017203 [Apostasia shenzhenica]|uniref:Uncharacterized protein n=1 Tax=Apostasia shenzhenica TaxID=1088818 RepID=A0A2H9ZVD8_9ASPA|nr:hypothetical protein AXF42_Ash017203 [Apostasia shenzhenica]
MPGESNKSVTRRQRRARPPWRRCETASGNSGLGCQCRCETARASRAARAVGVAATAASPLWAIGVTGRAAKVASVRASRAAREASGRGRELRDCVGP